MTEPPTERTALYRLFDSTDRLLYVGISKHPEVRWRQHAASLADAWWSAVARRTVQWIESRALAEAAEIEAIRNERPLYNTRHATCWGEEGFRGQPAAPKPIRDHLLAELKKSVQFMKACDEAKISAPEMIALRIKERIASGSYPIGSQLPTGRALSKEFGVSPPTLSRGMASLKAAGLVETRPGLGTFIVALPAT